MNLARPHAMVVDAAKQIFLVTVLGSQPAKSTGRFRKNVIYRLRIIRVLKGKAGQSLEKPAVGILEIGQTIQLPGEEAPAETRDETLSNHEDPRFWNRAAGRMGIDGDCSLQQPYFSNGRGYLILLGDPDDTKDLEEIGSDTHRWLLYVSKRSERIKAQ